MNCQMLIKTVQTVYNTNSIIIMQRRKIISNINGKPKLILDREKCGKKCLILNDGQCPITIAKLHQIKENRNSLGHLENHFGQSNKTKSLSKKPVFNVRHLGPLKTDPVSEKSLKQENPPSVSDEDFRSFLAKTMRQISLSPHIFHFSGDLTVSSILLSRLISAIIEGTSYNTIALNNISAKLSNLLQSEQEVSQDHLASRKKLSKSKIHDSCFKIESQFSYQFYHLAEKKDSIASCSSNSNIKQTSMCNLKNSLDLVKQSSTHLIESSKSTSSVESRSQTNVFIFQHLCDLDDYIFNQPNKILHQAVRRHKYLEQQLFAYADYLSISKLGTETYTPKINIPVIEDNIEREMRQLNRNIIQGEAPLESKFKMLRDFSLHLRESYNSIIFELMGVIDKKTSEIKVFVDKVVKWEENYLTRKEYLTNLKKDYCKELHSVSLALNNLRGLPACQSQDPYRLLSVIQQSSAAIDKIFLMGNSFY